VWAIKQPPKIIFGQNSVNEFKFPEKYLEIFENETDILKIRFVP